LAKQGYDFVITQDGGSYQEVAQEVGRLGILALLIHADMANLGDLRKVISQTKERFGGLRHTISFLK
jgi:hypothetical protein